MIRFPTAPAHAQQAADGCAAGGCSMVQQQAGKGACHPAGPGSAGMAEANGAGTRILCHCLQVTEAMVEEAIHAGVVQSLRDVIVCTGAGDGCTACRAVLRAYLIRRGVVG